MQAAGFGLCLSGMVLCAQAPIAATGGGGRVLALPTDFAVLESQEPRKDLACTITPAKPWLGFDLKFHTGYEVGIPLHELVGPGNSLTMIFRVIPENGKPRYFSQHARVPKIEEDATGSAYLQASFDVGEGRYKVDWLMRDNAERVCSAYWRLEAALPSKDKALVLELPPGGVEPADFETFRDEPPVEKAGSEPLLNVKILMNFAPLNAGSTVFQPVDARALVAVLRMIQRDPHIGRFSVVAFNLTERRVVYRQDNADRIDFPGLGEAVRKLNLGTVDMETLSQKHGDTEFLTNLIQKELGGEDHPDAVIFAGPKALLDENVPAKALKEVGEPDYPVFCMSYNLNPHATPWRDSIEHAVRFFRGYEYQITHPRDVWYAVTEMVSRTLNLRDEKRGFAKPAEEAELVAPALVSGASCGICGSPRGLPRAGDRFPETPGSVRADAGEHRGSIPGGSIDQAR